MESILRFFKLKLRSFEYHQLPKINKLYKKIFDIEEFWLHTILHKSDIVYRKGSLKIGVLIELNKYLMGIKSFFDLDTYSDSIVC
jgi:hypothetical protein